MQETEILLIEYEIVPAPESDDYNGGIVSDAFVWVRTNDEREADTRATKALRDAGWVVETMEGARFVSRIEFAGDHARLKLFDEAVAQGMIIDLETSHEERGSLH